MGMIFRGIPHFGAEILKKNMVFEPKTAFFDKKGKFGKWLIKKVFVGD